MTTEGAGSGAGCGRILLPVNMSKEASFASASSSDVVGDADIGRCDPGSCGPSIRTGLPGPIANLPSASRVKLPAASGGGDARLSSSAAVCRPPAVRVALGSMQPPVVVVTVAAAVRASGGVVPNVTVEPLRVTKESNVDAEGAVW